MYCQEILSKSGQGHIKAKNAADNFSKSQNSARMLESHISFSKLSSKDDSEHWPSGGNSNKKPNFILKKKPSFETVVLSTFYLFI